MSLGLHNIHSAAHVAKAKRQQHVGLRGNKTVRHSLAVRLAARAVAGPDGCLNIQGSPAGRNGYIQIADESGQMQYAHRMAWVLAHGPIPADRFVLHRCDNPRCANVEHLFLGTQHDNIHDCINKGRRNAFGRQKLTIADVLAIRARSAAGEIQRTIAADFGIRRHSVSGIVRRKSWAHVLPVVAQRLLQSQPEPAQPLGGRVNFDHQVFEPVPFRHMPVVGDVR